MAQVKKEEKRLAILESAAKLFRKKGYLGCRMEEIAADAGTAVANLYVYFPSKLHLFYAVWSPLMESRMLQLASDARRIADPRERLRFIFLTLWRDMPREDNGFAKNLIEAVVTAPADVEKPHEILQWCETFLNELVAETLPKERRFVSMDTKVSFLSWMAYDGFVVNAGKNEITRRNLVALVEHFADLLLTGKFEPVASEPGVAR